MKARSGQHNAPQGMHVSVRPTLAVGTGSAPCHHEANTLSLADTNDLAIKRYPLMAVERIPVSAVTHAPLKDRHAAARAAGSQNPY